MTVDSTCGNGFESDGDGNCVPIDPQTPPPKIGYECSTGYYSDGNG